MRFRPTIFEMLPRSSTGEHTRPHCRRRACGRQAFALASSGPACTDTHVHILDNGDFRPSARDEPLMTGTPCATHQGHCPSHRARETLHLSHALRVLFRCWAPDRGPGGVHGSWVVSMPLNNGPQDNSTEGYHAREPGFWPFGREQYPTAEMPVRFLMTLFTGMAALLASFFPLVFHLLSRPTALVSSPKGSIHDWLGSPRSRCVGSALTRTGSGWYLPNLLPRCVSQKIDP